MERYEIFIAQPINVFTNQTFRSIGQCNEVEPVQLSRGIHEHRMTIYFRGLNVSSSSDQTRCRLII